MEKVSIIIAAYNIQEYIGRCLKSCQNQSFKNIEIIVVNDGSIDETKKIIEKHAEIDERIIIINQKNMGLIEARKSGFKKAMGEYVVFIDGDDWLELNCIDKLYIKAKKKASDIVIYDYFLAYENNKLEYKQINLNKDKYITSILTNSDPYIWSKFIKRDYILKNKIEFPKGISYCEDLAFSVSLGLHNPKVEILNESLYFYFQRKNSITKKTSEKVLEICVAIKFIEKIIEQANLNEKLKEELEYCSFRYNFLNRINNIFLEKSKYSLELYTTFKNLELNMKKNKYFKKNVNWKMKAFYFVSCRSYMLGRIIRKIM